MNMRICSKCNAEYPETNEYFYKHSHSKGGLRAECKKCSYNYTLKRKERDIESYREIRRRCTSRRKDKVAQYQKEHKDIVYKSNRKWKQNNLEKIRMYSHKRRALNKQVETDFEEIDWNKCKSSFNNECAYCGKKKKLTREHFIPLVKGGEYTVNNIIPSCLQCNASKCDNDFFEWYPRQKYYSKERERRILKYLHYNKNKQQQLALF